MSISRLFFFVISLCGLIPAIFHTVRGKQTATEFVNNNRNFSLFQLSMTLFATVISLGGINLMLQGSFSSGLNTFLPWVLATFVWAGIMIFLIPKLNVFFKANHLGAVIEILGGRPTAMIIKLVVSTGAILLCVGQFKLGISSAYFFTDQQKLLFLWGFGLIIAIYVVRGGINSVVNSDIIQLFLGIISVIAIVFITLWYIVDNHQMANHQLVSSIKLDIQNIKFDAKFFNMLIIMSIPAFSPSYTSRLFLAKDKKLAQISFLWLLVGWVILSSILYITAKTIGIIAPDTKVLNIEHLFKALYPISQELQFILLISMFMFAVTTIDSLLQFVTVEIATIFTKDEKRLSKLFNIIPFILMFIICLVAQKNELWQLNYYYIFNLAQMLFLPVVTPIIIFYCITGFRFTKPTLPLVGIVTGVLTTLFIYFNTIFSAYLNPGIVGGIVNLLVLLIFKGWAKHEHVN